MSRKHWVARHRYFAQEKGWKLIEEKDEQGVHELVFVNPENDTYRYRFEESFFAYAKTQLEDEQWELREVGILWIREQVHFGVRLFYRPSPQYGLSASTNKLGPWIYGKAFRIEEIGLESSAREWQASDVGLDDMILEKKQKAIEDFLRHWETEFGPDRLDILTGNLKFKF